MSSNERVLNILEKIRPPIGQEFSVIALFQSDSENIIVPLGSFPTTDCARAYMNQLEDITQCNNFIIIKGCTLYKQNLHNRSPIDDECLIINLEIPSQEITEDVEMNDKSICTHVDTEEHTIVSDDKLICAHQDTINNINNEIDHKLICTLDTNSDHNTNVITQEHLNDNINTNTDDKSISTHQDAREHTNTNTEINKNEVKNNKQQIKNKKRRKQKK